MTEHIPEIAAAAAGLTTGLSTGGAWALRKMTGGAFDEVGTWLQRWTARRLGNVEDIVRLAEARAGELAENEEVHPRVVRRLLEEGSYVDDPLMKEYLAGLLLSARAETPDDDGLYLTRLVTDLTSRQIALHHAVYSTLVGAGDMGGRRSLFDSRVQDTCVEIELESLLTALGLPNDGSGLDYVMSSLLGLHRERLIGDKYQLRLGEEPIGELSYPGLLVQPTTLGAALLLSAYAGEQTVASMLNALDLGGPWLHARPENALVRPWELPGKMRTLGL